MAAVTGGAGTALIPYDAKRRGSWIINSDAVEGLMQTYVRDEWYKRDLREAAWPVMRRQGFVTDFDIVDRDVMQLRQLVQPTLSRSSLIAILKQQPGRKN